MFLTDICLQRRIKVFYTYICILDTNLRVIYYFIMLTKPLLVYHTQVEQTKPEERFQSLEAVFSEVSLMIDPYIGRFNLRENVVHLKLSELEESVATHAFCIAAYKATLFLCLIWPYGGKQRISCVRNAKDPLWMDMLLLSVFSMSAEFAGIIVEDSNLREFILTLFSKVKKFVKSRKESTKSSIYFLKTVLEKDMLTHVQWMCFNTVIVFLIKIRVFNIYTCSNTYKRVLIPIFVLLVEHFHG